MGSDAVTQGREKCPLSLANSSPCWTPSSPSASVWDVTQPTISGRFVYPHLHWAVIAAHCKCSPAVPVEKVILEAALNWMTPPGDRLAMPLPSFAIKFLNGLKKLMHLSHCLHSKKRIID